MMANDWQSNTPTVVSDTGVISGWQHGLVEAVGRGVSSSTAVLEHSKARQKRQAAELKGWSYFTNGYNGWGTMGSEAYEYFSKRWEAKREAAMRDGRPVWDVHIEWKHFLEDMACAVHRGNFSIALMNVSHPGGVADMPPPDVDPFAREA